jgi:hypothetical protein
VAKQSKGISISFHQPKRTLVIQPSHDEIFRGGIFLASCNAVNNNHKLAILLVAIGEEWRIIGKAN